MDTPIPIIRVSIDSMHRQMVHAFHGELLQLDEQFQAALEAALDPAEIKRLLEETAREVLRLTLKRAVDEYFLQGNGRDAVRSLVIEKLDAFLGIVHD